MKQGDLGKQQDKQEKGKAPEQALSFLNNNEEFGIYLVHHTRINFWGAGAENEDYF
ncbi:hypothetical protein [Alkaliphilus crotonatoxidans]